MFYLRLTITQDVIIQFSVETNSTEVADGTILFLQYVSIKTGWVRQE